MTQPGASSTRMERGALPQGRFARVLSLQRSAGNRAMTQLARVPAVKGGVETTVVSPAVRKLLEDKGIAYAREVTFELLDANGVAVIEGRFDIVFRTPDTKQLIFPELKGDKLNALTKGQKVYVPLFEGAEGAQVRITKKGMGNLHLPPGTIEHVHGENFFRIGSKNLSEFTAFVEKSASGAKVTNVYFDRGRLVAFKSQAEFEEFLVKKGIPVQKAAPKPHLPVSDKPLKPPSPATGPRPHDPLHDPPGRKPHWDPAAGPPQGHPSKKGPNYTPDPYNPDKPYKPKAPAGGQAGKAVKETEKAVVTEAEKVAAKEAEKVAAKSGRLWTRLVGKFGVEILEGLVPSPLDAIGLMVDFFGSYAEARETIRERNLQNGVAVGLAAYLVIPRWEWAKQFGHTVVSRDVITEILGTAGVAENAFNEGLVRGFLFGERHSKEQADRLRQKAFNTVLRQGWSVGHYVGDDVWSFDRDDVYMFAGVLVPTADWFLAEADRRRKAREAAERLRQQQKRWAAPPIGADKW